MYSNGISEEIIGKAIKKYKIPRHKLVILTKCFGPVGEQPGLRTVFYREGISKSKDYVNQHGMPQSHCIICYGSAELVLIWYV